MQTAVILCHSLSPSSTPHIFCAPSGQRSDSEGYSSHGYSPTLSSATLLSLPCHHFTDSPHQGCQCLSVCHTPRPSRHRPLSASTRSLLAVFNTYDFFLSKLLLLFLQIPLHFILVFDFESRVSFYFRYLPNF